MLFHFLSPFGKGFDHVYSPSHKHTLCQVRLKLVLWSWRRFFDCVDVFSLLPYGLSLEMGVARHFNKVESPISNCVVPSLVYIGPKKTFKLHVYLCISATSH